MGKPIDVDPVPIHLASVADGVKLGPVPSPYRKGLRRAVYRTITLQATDTTQEILPASDSRICAYVQALDDNITLAHTIGDAQNGSGALILKTNQFPWPVEDSDVVYASAQTYTGPGNVSRVTVTAYYRC